ncbi:HAD-IA family hydrolase [Thiobaca trueperi]|uniref:HAD superfamily hydrolase (TIGR01549 family) n=1 Tax=Thiobaca trueperi TaxID=127458 RepID=A0A4R3MZM6_9GAMM|nr:HAD-IA family hydrolase [Thiobaca trueperi]TCT22180.1 HAD superfamily hydrolase (TIGR01549 family) [Thiobaca trueperi]
MASPLISVIIPAYNHEGYVAEAVHSVLQQEEVTLEVIVIDDGSSDDTLAVLSAIDDPRLQLHHQANQGSQRTINRGLDLATGDYLAILNSDDRFHPRRLARLLEVSQAGGCDLILSDLRLIDAAGDPVTDPTHWWRRWHADLKARYVAESDPARALLTGNWAITTSNFFMTRAAYARLGGLRPFRYVLDYEYLLRAATTPGLKLEFLLDEPLLDYRLHGANAILEHPLRANLETDFLLRQYLPRVFGAEIAPGLAYLNRIKRHIVKLDREGWRRRWQATVDGLSESNTELHAINLELDSANRALNESNRDLHRINVELSTSNTGLHTANVALDQANQSLVAANGELDAERQRLNDLLSASEAKLVQVQSELDAVCHSRIYRFGFALLSPLHRLRRIGAGLTSGKPAHARDPAQLHQLIEANLDGVKLVSFDIFDTLLERLIDPPDHVKLIAARGLVRHLRVHLSREWDLADLLSLRADVEARLRRERQADAKDHECRFSDLAAEMARLLTGAPDPELADWIVAEELRAEGDCLYVKPGMESLLDRLRRRGLRVIAVSDMYLDQSHLEILFARLGLSPFIDQIYVSSDTGIGKYTGRLFRHVLETEGVAPQSVLHIGDNHHSDVKMALSLGLRAIWLDDRANNRRRAILRGHAWLAVKNPYWRGRHLMQLIAPEPSRGFAFDLGFSYLGPIFCTFIFGVIEKVRTERIERLFFLAREGELFLRLFEYLAPRLMEPEEIPAVEYLYVSRKSTAPAALADGLAYETSLAPLYNPKQQGLLSLCRTFDIPPADIREIAARHGYDLDEPIYDWHSPRYRALIEDPAFQSVVRRHGSACRELLGDYLAQNGFFSAQRVGLVDIGWNGSSQRYFQDAYGERADYPHVFGLYLGWVHGIRHSFDPARNTIFGLLYDVRRRNWLEDGVSRFEELFEEGARALHASTLGYARDANGRVEPVLKSDAAPDRRAELAMNPQIDDFRAGALAFAERFVHAARLTGYTFEEIRPFIMTLTERVVAHPTREEAQALMQVTHSEDFGFDAVMHLTHDRLRLRDFLSPRAVLQRLRGSNWIYGSGRLIPLPGLNPLLRYLDLSRIRP